MIDKLFWTRRDFIKAAGLAGAVPIVSGAISIQDGQAAVPQDSVAADVTLKGVSDLHIHANPDSRERAISELDFARQAQRAGYRSVMFKSNDFSCHDRAYLIREALPGFECFGSLCMNKVHGDKVNVVAAQKAVQTTGNLCRCIWMPTTDAAYAYKSLKRPEKGIPVLSDAGNVLPEVVRVMEICAEADIIFATGHSSPDESMVLARKAKEVGVKKFVVTHANSTIWKMTHDQIRKVVDLGGYIEFCYLTNLWGPGTGLPDFVRMSDAEFVAYVTVAPERSFITTDLGQIGMPNPLDGMRMCIAAMQKAGVPQKAVNAMVRTTPAMLMGVKL
jgi:Family of unknown function (DUF6282)